MRASAEAMIAVRMEAASEPPISDCPYLFYEMDAADGLTTKAARHAGRCLAVLARRYPAAVLAISLRGFDSDPRELVDVPRARDFLREFGRTLDYFSEISGELHGRLLQEHAALLACAMGRVPRAMLIFEPRPSAAPEARA